MSKISSLNFITLDISGKNYLSCILDVEINLEAEILEKPLKKEIKGPYRTVQKH